MSNPQSKEPSGTTAPMVAALSGHPDIVRVLLANAGINTRREDQWTASTAAACSDSAESVGTLLGAGAEINATNDTGYSALAFAIISEASCCPTSELRGALLRFRGNSSGNSRATRSILAAPLAFQYCLTSTTYGVWCELSI